MGKSGFVRSTGMWLIVGSLIGVGIGIKEAFAPTPFGTFENVVMQAIVIVANTLTLIGVVGLARSSAAGEGWLAKLGLGSRWRPAPCSCPSRCWLRSTWSWVAHCWA